MNNVTTFLSRSKWHSVAAMVLIASPALATSDETYSCDYTIQTYKFKAEVKTDRASSVGRKIYKISLDSIAVYKDANLHAAPLSVIKCDPYPEDDRNDNPPYAHDCEKTVDPLDLHFGERYHDNKYHSDVFNEGRINIDLDNHYTYHSIIRPVTQRSVWAEVQGYTQKPIYGAANYGEVEDRIGICKKVD